MKIKKRINLILSGWNVPKTLVNNKGFSFQEIPLPKIIEIEPINSCNLRCTMCHFSFMRNQKIQYIEPRLIKNLDGVEGRWVKIGSNFEPLMHPKFINIINMLSEMGCKIDLTTNGTLLSEDITDQIASSNIKNITISFDSIQKQTYEKIRRRSKFESVIEKLTYLSEKLSELDVFVAINTVLCRSNIDELIEIIDYLEDKKFHQLRLIFMVVRSLENDLFGKNDLLQESLYPFREYAFQKLDEAAKHVIQNRFMITMNSPYYNSSKLKETYPKNIIENIVKSDNPLALDYFNPGHYYQKGSYPGMRVDCKSPFTFVESSSTAMFNCVTNIRLEISTKKVLKISGMVKKLNESGKKYLQIFLFVSIVITIDFV